MKKAVTANICILMIILLTAGAHARPAKDSTQIEELFEQRIAILNHYYGGKMAFEDARSNIEKLVSGPLLEEDVRLMKAFDASGVDQVADYDLNLVSCKRSSYGIIKGQADIYWVMQGENGRWETEESYFYTAENKGDCIKLTQLTKN
mgnify:CR=1 FL=1